MMSDSPQFIEYNGVRGNMGPSHQKHWDSGGLHHVIEKDLSTGTNVPRAFDFMYNVFVAMLDNTPRALKDVSRFYQPEREPDYRDPKGPRAQQIELAASMPEYEQNPAARHMAKCALSDPSYATSVGLLTESLRHYTNFIYLEEDSGYQSSHPVHGEHTYLSPELPFGSKVADLWDAAEVGRFSEALSTLIPLVNIIADQEANGFFPIGIGVSGQNMSDVRYQISNFPAWQINRTSPEIMKAIHLAIEGHRDEFHSQEAIIYAANMLTIMADPEVGIGTNSHLVADLQWLMVCEDRLKKGLPLEKRNEGYPDVPWNYKPAEDLVISEP